MVGGMDEHPLIGPMQKYARATHQIQALKANFGAHFWSAPPPISVASEYDSDSETDFVARDKRYPTDPIMCWDNRSGIRRIVEMPWFARRIICRVQPYQRGDSAELHPLWVLHQLANYDKHHAIVPTAGAGLESSFSLIGPDGARHPIPDAAGGEIHFGPVYHGKEVARIPLPDGSSPFDIPAQLYLAQYETFAEPKVVAGRNVLDVLGEILRYIISEVFVQGFDVHLKEISPGYAGPIPLRVFDTF